MPITSPSNCSKLIRIRANAGALYNRKRASNNDHCTIYLSWNGYAAFQAKTPPNNACNVFSKSARSKSEWLRTYAFAIDRIVCPISQRNSKKHLWTHKIHRNVLCALQQQYDSRKADICQGQRQAQQQLKGAHNGDKLAKQRLQRAHQVRLAEDGADIGRSLHKHWQLNDYKEDFTIRGIRITKTKLIWM